MNDGLCWKAFLFRFGGNALFCNFVLLPLILGAAFLTDDFPSEQDAVVMVKVMATFVTFLAFAVAWDSVEFSKASTTGMQRKRKLLQLVKRGKHSMLYWNPIGWLFCLFRFLFWERALRPCRDFCLAGWEIFSLIFRTSP